MNGIPQGQGFEEPWTLWKTNLGYELSEAWIFPAQDLSGPKVVDVNVQMVTQLRPVKVRIGDVTQGLDCSVAIGVFACQGQGREAKLEVQSPYDFFSPSPWMLGNIVRRAQKIKNEKSDIRLVRINGADQNGTQLLAFEAEVQFVGEDQIEINGQKQPASIYELRSNGNIPAMLVWVSGEGIVYAIQDSSRPDQRLELTNFKRYGKM